MAEDGPLYMVSTFTSGIREALVDVVPKGFDLSTQQLKGTPNENAR
jgi:hypothetical protein